MANTVGLAMEQTCFVVEETTKGTAVFPSAAAEMIVGAGEIDINQQPTFSNSEEISNSLDVLERFQDQVGAGAFTLPMYLRPSGTAGTPPMGKCLFKSLCGAETISASTSVTYSQATTKPSFTLWVKKSHTLFFGTGACVDKCGFNATNKGGAKLIFSGGFMQLGWAGTDAVNGAVTSSTTVIVDDGSKFTAGAYVAFGSDDNSHAGYKISSVSGNTLTMADSITCADNVVIEGYLPTFTAVGTPLESKKTTISIDGTNTNIKSFNLDYSSPAIYQVDEITTDGYPVDYMEDQRSITGTLDMLFRQDDLGLFYDGLNDTSKAIIIQVGTDGGDIFKINLPYSELEVPKVTSSKPSISLSVAVNALGNAGEDSCTMVFT